MNLPQLPTDKANHLIYGALIGLVAFFALPLWWVPATAAALFGALKEISDAWLNYRATKEIKQGPHGVEWFDFLATACGGVILSLVCLRIAGSHV